jgi:hypothetical protein
MRHFLRVALLGGLASGCLFISAPARAAEWDKIDCSKSEVMIPDATDCWHGPVGKGASGACWYERYSAFHYANPPTVKGRMNVITLTNHRGYCWVAKSAHNEGLLRTSAPYVADKAKKWSPIRDFLSGYVASFVADNRECVSFVQYGPQFKSGYDYMFQGYYCTPGKQHISDEELEAAIKSVKVSR